MKVIATLSCLLLIATLAGCDLRSDTAKREMEKFSGTPTPPISPAPTEAPIDPADVVQVDTSLDGEKVTVNGSDQKKSIECKKYNSVAVSGGRNVITIKGACHQLTINGDRNEITAEAATTIMINGGNNTIKYARFANGKRPYIADNGPDNVVEKISAAAVTTTQSNRTIVK